MRYFRILLFFALFYSCNTKEENTNQKKSRQLELLIGSYSDGFFQATFLAETGEIKDSTKVTGVENPSFLLHNSGQDILFAVSENAPGEVVSFKKQDSTWVEVSRKNVAGDHPCFLALDATEKWLFVGNYSSGNFSVFEIKEEGLLGELKNNIQHSGKSINKQRQNSPHVHSIYLSTDNKKVYVTDLGTDQIWVYKFDSISGELIFERHLVLPPGSGPRHVALHPTLPLLYVALELQSAVAVIDSSGTILEQRSTLPEEELAGNTCAHIVLDRDSKNLYVSNRGHDSIAHFKVGMEGRLEIAGYYATLGQTPRNFALSPDEKHLLVANQNSDNLLVYDRNVDSGILSAKNRTISFQKPVFLLLGSAKE